MTVQDALLHRQYPQLYARQYGRCYAEYRRRDFFCGLMSDHLVHCRFLASVMAHSAEVDGCEACINTPLADELVKHLRAS